MSGVASQCWSVKGWLDERWNRVLCEQRDGSDRRRVRKRLGKRPCEAQKAVACRSTRMDRGWGCGFMQHARGEAAERGAGSGLQKASRSHASVHRKWGRSRKQRARTGRGASEGTGFGWFAEASK